METTINEVEVNGVKYVRKDSVTTTATNTDGMPFVLVRGYGSGVQYGYLKSRNGCEVELIDARRIWSWNKATETMQISVEGISKSDSKVTVSVPKKSVLDVIEVLVITGIAIDNLKTQPIWKK